MEKSFVVKRIVMMMFEGKRIRKKGYYLYLFIFTTLLTRLSFFLEVCPYYKEDTRTSSIKGNVGTNYTFQSSYKSAKKNQILRRTLLFSQLKIRRLRQVLATKTLQYLERVYKRESNLSLKKI